MNRRNLEYIRKVYRKLLPGDIRNRITPVVIAAVSVFTRSTCRGQLRQSFGPDNPDKTFYVIRTGNFAVGLFALTSTIIDHIQYAERKGWIPIIDTKNYYNPGIQDIVHKYKEDAWDYYYERINEARFVDIWMSKRVVFSSLLCEPYCRYRLSGYDPLSTEDIRYLNGYLSKKLVIKPDIAAAADDAYNRLIRGKKVIGVAYRSSFKYLEMNNDIQKFGHAKQGSLEQYGEDIDRLIKTKQYEYIFVSVDDRDIMDHFQEIYQDRCLFVDRALPVRSLGEWNEILREFKRDAAAMERLDIEKECKNYLIETILLSRCSGLIASRSGNLKFAQIWNNGEYEDQIIYNDGLMGN